MQRSVRTPYDRVVMVVPVTIPYVRYSIESAQWWIGRALKSLVDGAGITPRDIDGFCVSSFTAGLDSGISLTQHFGLCVRWIDTIPLGGASAIAAIASAPKPVIAAVNGAAAGGGASLALACDIRVASDRASIGQLFNRIGLHPDLGSTFFLPRLVGLGKALELVFTGDMIDAAEGHRLGLFNRIVAADTLMNETRALAERLVDKPPLAIARAKKTLYQGSQPSLDDMLAIEVENQVALFSTHDAREGIEAFAEKRPPHFRGV